MAFKMIIGLCVSFSDAVKHKWDYMHKIELR